MLDPLRTLTTNLRSRRAELGLSQEAVAGEASMDQSQYSRIERGEVDPSIRTLTRVSRALQTTPSELLRGIV
ncbi:helix-turn-helix domain-containing protein [Baekduia sp. Peel2402]|uniref:helix-turn-helix domain-containing protein n=1 Tax=Baekduia sp. Peel2402 TaxID=3458296 RepID=UPI00403EF3C4